MRRLCTEALWLGKVKSKEATVIGPGLSAVMTTRRTGFCSTYSSACNSGTAQAHRESGSVYLHNDFILDRLVHNDVVGRSPIGQNNGIALRRNENDIKNLNFPHLARFSLQLNDIAYHVGLEKEYKPPAREIGQRTLQR